MPAVHHTFEGYAFQIVLDGIMLSLLGLLTAYPAQNTTFSRAQSHSKHVSFADVHESEINGASIFVCEVARWKLMRLFFEFAFHRYL